MRVFISWSGERSRAVADVLRQWLPSVLQAVRPYFSPDDVAKGSRWSTEIANELEASCVGLLVITTESHNAPWLLFEAGALAKSVDQAKVCPLLFEGMQPADVTGPLVQFQAARFSEEEMRRVVKMINNELADAALPPEVLEPVFDMWWPKLLKQVNEALAVGGRGGASARRTDRDLLEEILALSRRSPRDRALAGWSGHPAWMDLLVGIGLLARVARSGGPDEELAGAISSLIRPLEFLARRTGHDGDVRVDMVAQDLLRELRAGSGPGLIADLDAADG